MAKPVRFKAVKPKASKRKEPDTSFNFGYNVRPARTGNRQARGSRGGGS